MDTTAGLQFGLCDTDDGERIALFSTLPYIYSNGKRRECRSLGTIKATGRKVCIFDGKEHPWRAFPRTGEYVSPFAEEQAELEGVA